MFIFGERDNAPRSLCPLRRPAEAQYGQSGTSGASQWRAAPGPFTAAASWTASRPPAVGPHRAKKGKCKAGCIQGAREGPAGAGGGKGLQGGEGVCVGSELGCPITREEVSPCVNTIEGPDGPWWATPPILHPPRPPPQPPTPTPTTPVIALTPPGDPPVEGDPLCASRVKPHQCSIPLL